MRPILFLIFNLHFTVFTGAVSNFALFAQEFVFSMGDTIAYEFLGEKKQGKIVKFTATGWPVVMMEYRGRTREKVLHPSKVTLVPDAGVDAGALSSEQREWVDSTGKYRIQAKLLSYADGKAELQKTDGKIVTLEESRLSAADQKFLADLKSTNTEDNPFEGGVSAEDSGRSGGVGSRAAAGTPKGIVSQPAVVPDYSRPKKMIVDQGWKYKPTAVAKVAFDDRVFMLGTTSEHSASHNRYAGTAFNTDRTLLAVARELPFDDRSEVTVIDLENGSASPPAVVELEDAKLLSINNEGSKIATLKEAWGSEPGGVDFWKYSESGLEHEARWSTAGFHDHDGFSPEMGRYVGDEYFLTIGKRLILWNIATAKAEYSIKTSSKDAVGFSACGKEVAFLTPGGVNILDIASGRLLGKFRPPAGTSSLAFSRDGKFLAGKRTNAVWVWDLESQELAGEIAVATSIRPILWVNNHYLLVDEDLCDVRLRVPVWKYKHAINSMIHSMDGRCWYAGKTKIVPIQIPHKNIADQTAHLTPDSLQLLKPGESVAMSLNLPFTAGEEKEIRDRITSELAANGVTVDAASDLSLELKVLRGKKSSIKISTLGDMRERIAVNVSFIPNLSAMAIKKDGRRLWARTRSHRPSIMIPLKAGKSAQQVVDQICKPDPRFFLTTKLPFYLSSLPPGDLPGTSKVSESGIH